MTTVPEYVARVVADAPPLSDETTDRIALLLRPTRASNHPDPND
ncbi:hypothetical protein [Arthrobacter sp. H-02-3]|nr:hypothetical protein [Arthrobacter sp. H-02-3]